MNCEFLKNGWFNCKPCRLKKCQDVGMTIENFQFDRDSFSPKKAKIALENFHNQVPFSIATFTGRSNLIVISAPTEEECIPKCYIDVQFLIDKLSNVLKEGPEVPLHTPNALEKLALGLQIIRGRKRELKLITKLGKEETLGLWQDDMMKVAKWLTYFDDFQQLSHRMRSEMLKGMWKVWSRLETLALTAMGRRLMICQKDMIMTHTEKEQVMAHPKQIEVDISWCSRYTLEQLRFFADSDLDDRNEQVIQAMMELQPTDVELSYMMCQACLHYAGKRYQGEVLEIAERFQETLSNHLHDYYVNRMNMPQYSMRVANLMKINNHIQLDIYRGRVKYDLARVFDVFYLEFSHPEVFIDL